MCLCRGVHPIYAEALFGTREAIAAASAGDPVNVVPQPKAGGSMATQAYLHFKNPVVVEEIKADAGIDIGFTLIGMHLKKVAVPVRLDNNKIGEYAFSVGRKSINNIIRTGKIR